MRVYSIVLAALAFLQRKAKGNRRTARGDREHMRWGDQD